MDRPKQPAPFDDDDLGDLFPAERPTSPGADVQASGEEERPTVSPPFDFEEYARSSESSLHAAKPFAAPAPPAAPLAPPAPRGEASTKPPPAPPGGLAESSGKMPALRPPQITLTDEDELETARLRSVLMNSEPPPGGRARGSLANAAPQRREERAPVESSLPPTVQFPVADFEEKDPFADLPPAPASPDAATREVRTAAAKRPASPADEMRDRMSLGDYSGALEVAESILAEDPLHAEAIRVAEECRATLLQMYTARIGPMDRVPMVMVPREQLRWLSIDHRAGFLLSHIDGVSSLEMILDVSGMPTLDALRILFELAQQRVISFR